MFISDYLRCCCVLPNKLPPAVEVVAEPKRPPGCAVEAPKAGAGLPKADVPAAGAGCPKAGCVAPKALVPKADPPEVPEPKAGLLNIFILFH